MSSVIDKLNLKEIKKIFTDGIKSKNELKIGIEYERPAVSYDSNAVQYDGYNGICEFLRLYARNDNWDYILDENNIIGLKKLHDTITLEPGMQLELSLEPQISILEIEERIKETDEAMKPILNDFGIKLLNYGVSPLSTFNNIKILPKRRYSVMANYLWGILADVMMRETAGIQVCVDFESEDDAQNKFRIANMLSPFATAMFANSPIRGGVDTGYKSFRALSWLNTDSERCGFATDFSKDFTIEDYINKVLETPVIMVERNNNIYPVNGTMTLNQLIRSNYHGIYSPVEDFKLAANLYFPDVRLRKFIEIRNQDCVKKELQYAMLAFYKGILYSKTACEKVDEILSKYTNKDFCDLRYNVPKMAMNAKLEKYEVKDIAKELVNIAEIGLKEQNTDEERYLDSLKEFVSQGLCPADIILKNWYGSWNKNIDELINFSYCESC